METLTLIMTIYSILKEIAYSWMQTLGEVGTVHKLTNEENKNKTEPDKRKKIIKGTDLKKRGETKNPKELTKTQEHDDTEQNTEQ